jgi:hypothetical protein
MRAEDIGQPAFNRMIRKGLIYETSPHSGLGLVILAALRRRRF